MSNLRVLNSADDSGRPEWLTSRLFPFTSRFAEFDGTRVHYVDEGNGPILVL